MENVNRYNKLNEYLKNKFGERTLKICIDGGFTCPNRDGTVSNGGCIFFLIIFYSKKGVDFILS